MDSRRAREILSCYRPGVDDPESEPFAAAFEQARRDRELSSWLEREIALDAAIGAKLRGAAVPEGLKSRILAGAPAARPAPWWRRPIVALAPVAIAAAAAIAFFLAGQRSSAADFPTYRAEMAAMVAGGYKMDLESEELSTLREFFASRGWPSDYTVPKPMEQYPLEGGMTVTWHGIRVSVLCFGTEDDEKKDKWLFVADARALSGAPSSATPEFATAARLITAAWSSGDRIYVLAGWGDEPSLRRYL